MCSSAIIGTAVCRTQAHLARALACTVYDLPLCKEEDGSPMYNDAARDGDYCLCPIDHSAIATAWGYRLSWSDHGDVRYEES